MLTYTQDTLMRFIARQPLMFIDDECVIHHIPNMTRDIFATVLASMQMNVGAEVGVERGDFSKTLMRANPLLHLYGVDPWTALPDYRVHLTQAFMDEMYERVCTRLRRYHWTPIRCMSEDIGDQIPDGSLDFVYIDANHEYTHVLRDLDIWTKKVRRGGIISGHDYTLERQREPNGVVAAVNKWTADHDIKPWFVLGSDEYVVGEVRDRARSFFWVNP